MIPPAERSAATAPGTVLAGKYRVERLIGQGGMGVVLEARHLALDERIALKLLAPSYAMHADASRRFLREARAAVKIKGEHVARVLDVGTLEDGAPYMVMEYLDGLDLGALVQRRGPLPLPEAVDYMLQACEAIAEAHAQGIIHRDLKPSNLFLARRPDGTAIVKVLDFGISKLVGDVDALTRTNATLGSALYMAPEQMQRMKEVDCRADVYAIGITLFELLTATQPFWAETLPQLCAEILTGQARPLRSFRPDLSDALAAILERAYARDRDQRYQSVAELANAFAPYAPEQAGLTLQRIARISGVPPAATAPPAAAQGLGAPLPAQGTPVIGDSGRILLGPYSAPASSKAAAAFATHTKITLSRTNGGLAPSRLGLGIAAVLFACVAAIGLAIAWRVHLNGSADAIASHAADAQTSLATAPPPATAAPAGTAAAAPEPSTQPTAATTATPSASASALPLPTPRPPLGHPAGKPSAAKPPGQPKPMSLDVNDR